MTIRRAGGSDPILSYVFISSCFWEKNAEALTPIFLFYCLVEKKTRHVRLFPWGNYVLFPLHVLGVYGWWRPKHRCLRGIMPAFFPPSRGNTALRALFLFVPVLFCTRLSWFTKRKKCTMKGLENYIVIYI